jgi:hypothetical protein
MNDLVSAGKPRSLLRRYVPDLAVLAATAVFLVVVSVLGLWLMRSG